MNEETKPQLLPCPFCYGSQSPTRPPVLRDGLPFVVVCPSCGATGPEGVTAARAIEKWDTRPYRLAVESALASVNPAPLVVTFFRPVK